METAAELEQPTDNVKKGAIKKRANLDIVSDSDDNEPPISMSTMDSKDLGKLEAKKRSKLISYLAGKGVESCEVDGYVVRCEKRKDIRTSYVCPDGSILDSEEAVFKSIQNGKKKSKISSEDENAQRHFAHEMGVRALKSTDFPAEIGGIVVTDLGVIDTRPTFHNTVQLYPLGYKCEQTVFEGTPSCQEIKCEILEFDGAPEFHITSRTSGESYFASTEAAVWRKFIAGSVETDVQYSFFNLKIELLIEGLPNALECEEYKFHLERGYTVAYTSEVVKLPCAVVDAIVQSEARAHKISYLAKSGRERRLQERHKNRNVARDDGGEGHAKRSAEEREQTKKLQEKEKKLEKERKEKEREDARRLKEKQKAEESRRKQMEKERSQQNKARQQLRKEIMGDVKKNRADAHVNLLQCFDAEEDLEEQREELSAAAELSAAKSGDVCELLSNFCDVGAADGGLDVDCLVHITSALHVFRSYLGYENSSAVDDVLRAMRAVSFGYSEAAQNQSAVAPEAVADESDRMEVEDASLYTRAAGSGGSATARQSSSSCSFAEYETAVAAVDRIQLHVMRKLLDDLQTFVVSDERRDPEGKYSKAASNIRLPLNQLTWVELARLSILCFLYSSALGKPYEETQHMLRGSKHPGYRITKNIVRNIRYRLLIRTKQPAKVKVEDDVNAPLLRFLNDSADAEDRLSCIPSLVEDAHVSPSSETYPASSTLTNEERKAQRPFINAFNTEQEMLSTLLLISANGSYSEVYQRCCKVLIRVLSLPQSRNFLWEVDSEAYPDYYNTVRRPIMLSHIATNLVNKTYGLDDCRVACEFYRDMRQVALNCVSFNTETTIMVGQAQKLLVAIYRYSDRWLHRAFRPFVDQCDERYCMLSKSLLSPGIPGACLKCGKCTAVYSHEALRALTRRNAEAEDGMYEDVDETALPFIVLPTQEVVDQTNEEWVCPFCLRDDSAYLRRGSGPQFFVDEWGPTASTPWLLNPVHSTAADSLAYENPRYRLLLEALAIVSNPNASGVFASTHTQLWTLQQRVVVLGALCVVLRGVEDTAEEIERIQAGCEKLLRICAKTNFREADFMSTVREISGDQCAMLCRSLLDGLDSSESYLQNIVTEGRCVVCSASTFDEDLLEFAINRRRREGVEEDEEGEVQEEQVILCDGCNAEAHMSCLHMTTVPSEDWYCAACSERNNARELLDDSSFDNIDKHRLREHEDELLNTLMDRRCDKDSAVYDEDVEEIACGYCGLTCYETCSPLVIGQSRAEHNAAVAAASQGATADGLLGSRDGTAVRFFSEGVQISAGKLDFPFFPIINSVNGRKLMDACEEAGEAPVVVHQLCALQMFQARATRSKHTLRRRRKQVGSRAVLECGISLQPLGYDGHRNEYWKLPNCDDLFVRLHAEENRLSVEERRDFSEQVNRARKTSARMGEEARQEMVKPRGWKRVPAQDVLSIVEALADSGEERLLKKTLLSSLVLDRKMTSAASIKPDVKSEEAESNSFETGIVSFASVSNLSPLNDRSSTISDEKPERGTKASKRSANENTPVSLALLPNKGVALERRYSVAEESAFEDVVVGEDAASGNEFFTFSKGKKFFAVALLNKAGNIVKASHKLGVTVIYQVHREGISAPITYSPLQEAWSDSIYYFAALQFKRAGRYTISFLVEGNASVASIKPLIFPVVVEAQYVRCGISDALSKVNARNYFHFGGRQVQNNRKEVMAYVNNVNCELSAIKCLLLSIYLALPVGALVSEPFDLADMDGAISEPAAWNDVLDQAWRGLVFSADTAAALMESALLLEFYINKSWLQAPHSRLLQVLPSAHFAIRCASYSSVALRLYSLDRALDYEKTVAVPQNRFAEESGRAKRSAAAEASARIRNLTENPETIVSWDDYGSSHNGFDAPVIVSGMQWTCLTCATVNEARARTCDACGEKKPSVAQLQSAALEARAKETRGGRENRSAALQARKRRIVESDDEFAGRRGDDGDVSESELAENDDDDEVDDSDDSVDSDGYSRTKRKRVHDRRFREREVRHSGRQRRAVTYYGDEYGPADPVEDLSNLRRSGRTQRQGSSSFRSFEGESDDDDDYRRRRVNAKKKQRQLEEEEIPVAPFDLEMYRASLPERLREFDDHIAEIEEAQRSREEGYEWSASPMTAEAAVVNIRCLRIMKELMRDFRSQPFWEPVDPVEVPGYHDFIKQPMDLGTITERIRQNHYASRDEFAADVRLVWSNCQQFNMEHSLLYDYSIALGDIFEQLLEENLGDVANVEDETPGEVVNAAMDMEGAGLRSFDRGEMLEEGEEPDNTSS